MAAASAVAGKVADRDESAGGIKGEPEIFFRNFTREFKDHRSKMISNQLAESKKILCRGRYTPAKRKAMLREMDRLMKGFAENLGFFKNLAFEVKAPNWQKSDKWVESCKADQCYQCKKRFPFSFVSKKINCRIGGQVFCKECGDSEIVIYLKEKQGEPKWMINGKGGVEKTKMNLCQYEVYSICSGCASDLETILAEEQALLRQRTPFTDTALTVYQGLSKLQCKLDERLPKYQREVAALDGVDVTTVEDTKNKKLAKLHLDMYQILSLVKSRSDNDLLKLSPEREVDETLHKRLQSATFLRYDEHSRQFSNGQQELVSRFPSQVDVLFKVQKESSRQSMESVYIDISQLKDDLSRFAEKYNLDPSLSESMTEILRSVREEFKPFLRDREKFDQHFRVATIDKKSIIKVSGLVEKQSDMRIVVVSQCSTIVHGCLCRLEAEALDQEFQQTKKLLIETCKKLESAIAQYFNYTIPT